MTLETNENKSINENTQKINIKISVRNLVEFILRSGDIDSGFRSSGRAVEGTYAHQKVQKAQDDNYQAEVSLKYEFELEDFKFLLEGRADGIIKEKIQEELGQENRPFVPYCIDEIKSTTRDLQFIDENYNPLHWGQAKCYGYIYCKQNNLNEIDIQLTYFHLETELTKRLRKTYKIEELEQFFFNLIEKYIVWANFTKEWSITRDTSIKTLNFPFDTYRKGQRNLAVATYQTIKENKKLYAQAPTTLVKRRNTSLGASS